MAKAKRAESPVAVADQPRRPAPPAGFVRRDDLEDDELRFLPAPELKAWVAQHILDEAGALHNPDHLHLVGADLEFIWCSGGFNKQGRRVLGMCELVQFRSGPWQSGRERQVFREWFGRVPAFVITIDAAYAEVCSAVEFCSLIEHEITHLAQKEDAFGAPVFDKEGNPKLAIRDHDCAEFVGIVRRYGASAEVQAMIDAAKLPPEVQSHSIARACGTCLKGV